MVSIVRASNEHLPQCDHLIDPACRVPRAQETIGPTRFSPTPGGGASTDRLTGDGTRCGGDQLKSHISDFKFQKDLLSVFC